MGWARIARIDWLKSDACTQQWLQSTERFLISPDLPLLDGPLYHKASSDNDSVFHHAIADTQLDGWGCRVGALRLRDEHGIFLRNIGDGQRAPTPLLELAHVLGASRAVELKTETEADLLYLRGRGTSLGGLRPKCSIVDDDGYLAIGKFPSITDERSVTKGEILALFQKRIRR